mgnify:CR=1 FL=1
MQAIVAERCQGCHNAAMPSKNVRLDSPQAIATHAQQVYQQAVVLKVMPLNNFTRITDAERAQIGRWFGGGRALALRRPSVSFFTDPQRSHR